MIPITELKRNLAKIVKQVNNSGEPVYVLQRSRVTSVILDVEHYAALEKALENASDIESVKDRGKEKRVKASDVARKIGL
jgi:prevent-host-death family protein